MENKEDIGMKIIIKDYKGVSPVIDILIGDVRTTWNVTYEIKNGHTIQIDVTPPVMYTPKLEDSTSEG